MADKLIPEQRRRALVEILEAEGVVRLDELARRLAVSVMTVRRDVAALAEQGSVVGVTGGVKLVATRPPIERTERVGWQREAKRAIARVAAARIPDGATIYLDAGTTCQLMAEQVATRRGLTVVTNDLLTAVQLLPARGIELIHLGGEVDPISGSTAGAAAERALRHLSLDWCFLSAGTWSIEHGVTSAVEAKAELKRAAVEVADAVALVADSSKFGLSATYRVAGLAQLDVVITDDRLEPAARRALAQLPVEAVLVPAPRHRADQPLAPTAP